ncbi:MAG: hypothetical protein NZ700_00780, partial [Gemmataceae bacterium]|nr:hypothetical protein [Gemmataceae bacterium]MDW8266363.1 hypothetical protein [Gemmataceae bacterium]
LLREAQARFDNLQRQLRELFTETCHRLAGEAGPPAAPLQAPDLLGAILAEFDALLRERYSHQRRVPVYELRRNLARKLGPAAASHDRFDPAVKLLRQQNRIRLVPISDLRDATADQLNDSVPGINETFFYLEPVHEPVAPR